MNTLSRACARPSQREKSRAIDGPRTAGAARTPGRGLAVPRAHAVAGCTSRLSTATSSRLRLHCRCPCAPIVARRSHSSFSRHYFRLLLRLAPLPPYRRYKNGGKNARTRDRRGIYTILLLCLYTNASIHNTYTGITGARIVRVLRRSTRQMSVCDREAVSDRGQKKKMEKERERRAGERSRTRADAKIDGRARFVTRHLARRLGAHAVADPPVRRTPGPAADGSTIAPTAGEQKPRTGSAPLLTRRKDIFQLHKYNARHSDLYLTPSYTRKCMFCHYVLPTIFLFYY